MKKQIFIHALLLTIFSHVTFADSVHIFDEQSKPQVSDPTTAQTSNSPETEQIKQTLKNGALSAVNSVVHTPGNISSVLTQKEYKAVLAKPGHQEALVYSSLAAVAVGATQGKIIHSMCPGNPFKKKSTVLVAFDPRHAGSVFNNPLGKKASAVLTVLGVLGLGVAQCNGPRSVPLTIVHNMADLMVAAVEKATALMPHVATGVIEKGKQAAQAFDAATSPKEQTTKKVEEPTKAPQKMVDLLPAQPAKIDNKNNNKQK